MLFIHYLPPIILVAAGMFISVKTNKLTLAGAITGGVIGMLTFAGAGYAGIAMLSAFFICGTLATVWKKKEKQQLKSTEDKSTKRKASQVFANGGVAAIAGALILILPKETELLRLIMAASLSSAMADTLSSELGMVYGRRFYNIISFRKEQSGLDGVVSIEGTLIGVAGSILIAMIYAVGFGWSISFGIIIIAGTIGNLSDSVLGALLERRRYLSNDAVNFLNTFIAALSAWLLITIS
jgi:uncharacterized protein (TIGR00297 family)